MARRYTRDNRGRFASAGGGGATARGGRLRTAAGNKRKTQTMRAQGAGGVGVIKGRAARTVAGESVMRKLPKAAPKATAKGKALGGDSSRLSVATKQAAYRSANAKAKAARKESDRFNYKNEPYNPKNFFGRSAVRDANMAKASPETLAEFKSLQKASNAFARGRLKAGKANVEASNRAFYARGPANASRPGTMLRPKPTAAKAKPAAPAKAKAAKKLAFGKSDFERRSQRTANIRNPEVRQKAQRLYGKILDLSSTPKQLKSMFKKAGKPKAPGRSALNRQRQRDHKTMLAAAPLLFR